MNQWQDSDVVINWFRNTKNKGEFIVVQLQIEEFYPSISKDLLFKSVDYTKGFLNISDEETKIIMHCLRVYFLKKIIFLKEVSRYYI